MRVDIWSDVVCPWCYIGKARFEKALGGFSGRGEVEVVYRSFELDPARDAARYETALDMLAGKYGMAPGQARQAEERVAGLARSEGLPYSSQRPVGNTFDLHRVLRLGRANGVQHDLLAAIYQAYFGEARQIFDPSVIAAVAGEAGLDAEAVRQVLDDGDRYASEVRADEDEARRLGITGVPFFVFDMTLGVSGAQPAETFTQAMDQAWARAAG